MSEPPAHRPRVAGQVPPPPRARFPRLACSREGEGTLRPAGWNHAPSGVVVTKGLGSPPRPFQASVISTTLVPATPKSTILPLFSEFSF